jgi:hypothetical protein
MNLTRGFALKGHLLMSRKELERKTLLEEVKQGRRTLLGIYEALQISYRQCRRIYRRYLKQADAGLVHGSRGKASNRRTDPKTRQQILQRYQERYAGFGPTFAAEKLAEEGWKIDHETLRRWLVAEGLWQRQRGRGRHRQRRPRREHFGELVQLDGSHHEWWPAEKTCLLNMVDDATSQRWGLLAPEETTAAAMQVLWQWIERYGIPRALYVDLKNVYLTDRQPTVEEQLAGEPALTAFGKACQKLGIVIQPAYSPQAKGRVERNHGTDQDRLVKELHLRKIRTVPEANAFLKKTYWKQINTKFSVPAAQPQDFHRPLPEGLDLGTVFCWEEKRRVNADWTVYYETRCLQILKDQTRLPRPKDQVVVRKRLDGRLEILYRGRSLSFQQLILAPRRAPEKALRPASPRRKQRPAADHPWRRPAVSRRPAESVRSQGR